MSTDALSGKTRNIVISGTNYWNPGDDFVRDGVIQVLQKLFPDATLNFLFYNFNPEFLPQSKFKGIGNFASRGDLDRYREHIDAVVIAGLSAGEEIKDLYQWVLDNGLDDRVYMIGAGYENDYVASHISQDPEATIFRNARIIIGRTEKTPGFIPEMGLNYVHLNCPALLSVKQVKQVAAGRKIERIGFSIQLAHDAGLVNQSCPPSQARLAQEILLDLSREFAVEVIAHHKSEYFYFLNALKGRGIPVLFSSFYQDLHQIYPRYDLVITTRLHSSLFANGHGIPGIIVNDTDRHTHTLQGFPHSTWINTRAGFDREFQRVRGLDLAGVASEATVFKKNLTAQYLEHLAVPFGLPKSSGAVSKPAITKPSSHPPVARSAYAAGDPLPIHFFTIVINGKPFVEHHINAFNKLPFAWHWHIVEGIAEQNHDTAWSKEIGGTINRSLHRGGLSTDGTTEYLDSLAAQYPGQITLYRKPAGKFWDGKLEMVNAPLANISRECLLWQIDADELWTANQIQSVRKLFLSLPEKTAAYYLCHYFVGQKLVTTTRNTYGNHLDYEWIRTWRFRPGDRWTSHEPPRLCRAAPGGQMGDIAAINPLRHSETEALDLVFQHYAYTTEAQLRFKEVYYGYKDAVKQWRNLQRQTTFPARLAEYFDWVKDATEVNTIQSRGIVPLAPESWFNSFSPSSLPNPNPKRILFVRTDSIGDTVLAASMLEPIRERFPQAQIAILCQEHIAELFVPCPHTNAIICFDTKKLRNDEAYRNGILKDIREFAPDLILNSIYSRESGVEAVLLKLKGIPAIGMEGDHSNISVEERLASNALYNHLVRSPGTLCHELDRHLDFLSALGISPGELQPSVWTTPEDEALAQGFFEQENLDPAKTIAVFPGSLLEIKTYPRLAEGLAPLKGHQFLVFGGADVEEICGEFARKLPGAVINLAGKTTLREMAALIRRCRMFVGVDSSGAHIACAVGVPNVVILGGGHFGRFFPYSPLTTAVVLPLECFGCGWRCNYSSNHCIKDIAPEVLAAAIGETLAATPTRPRIFLQGNYSRKTGMEPRLSEIDRFIGQGDFDVRKVAVFSLHEELPARPIPLSIPLLPKKSLSNTNPASVKSWLKEAVEFAGRDKRNEACASLKRVIAAAPQDAESLIAAGNLALQLGDNSMATDAYALAATALPNDGSLQVLVAAASLRAGRKDAFEQAIGRSLELNPANVDALRLLAEFNVQQNNFLESARNCARILQIARSDIPAMLLLGRCLFALGDLLNARDTYARILKLDPQNTLASENLAVVLAKLGNANTAPPPQPEVNTAFLNAAREFWNVETMQQAMFERVFTDSRIAAMPEEERKAAWDRSALDSARQVTEDLPTNPEWKVLEIGCGVGRIVRPLRERFARVDGVDISKKMVGFAQDYLRSAPRRGNISLNNGYDLAGLQDADYDFVYSTIVFQHIRSASVVKSYFREACRVLSPGGYFRIQVHERTDYFGKANEEAQSGKQYEFAGNGYTPEELKHLLEEAGFNEIAIKQRGSWIWATSRRPYVANASATANGVSVDFKVPAVSAIVSTCNSEKFIRGCLEDLLAQTIADQMEIIVIDSGSDQNERAIVEEYQKRHSNIRYVRTARETIYAAWNRGAKMARGKYLTNANTDDRHRPDAIEQMARALDANPSAGVVYGDSNVTCDANAAWGAASVKGRFFWPDFDLRLLFDVCLMGPHPLWRRNLHGTHGFFDANYKSAGDYEFWIRLGVAGVKMIHLPDVVGLYLERPESISLSDGNLSWKESEQARNTHWPTAWGKRPQTNWRSFERPVSSTTEKHMKVLLACDYFWPSVGGVELYVEEMGKNLQAAGCTVEIACRHLPERSGLEHAGLRIHEFDCANEHGFSLSLDSSNRLRRVLFEGKFDCVAVLSQPDNWLEAVVREAGANGIRVVFLPSINETNVRQWQDEGSVEKVFELLKAPDELVSVTEHGCDIRFINRSGRTAAFIPHAVSRDADPKNFRVAAGFDPERPLLVMVANFWPVKNHLETLKVLELTEGDWQVGIIGHRISHLGDYHDQVAKQVARDSRVKLLGGLPPAIAASAIRDADLLLVPSKGESAGPLVVLQAMSHGTPWIATPHCNAVADEAGGIVAELRDFPAIIHALLASPEKCQELGRLGQQHWEGCFTWQKSVPAFLAVLRGTGVIQDLRMPLDLRERNAVLQREIASLCPKRAPEAAATPLVSVIIPTHNRSATLIQCLEALARQTVPASKFEVIVSDDGSTDDTAERIKAHKAPFALKYLRQKNSGPAAARNRAIEQARGHYLYILNDDAILESNAMAIHLAAHENRPGEKIAVLGRFTFPSDLTGTPFGYALEHSDLLFTYVRMKSGEKYDFNNFFTCNVTVPRQAVLDAGMFDEVFTGPAAEDIELGYRLFKRGYEVVYEPACVAWHHHNMTPRGFCRVHRTRGEGAITLLLQQPEAPWYRGTDFGNLNSSLEMLKANYPAVDHVVSLIEKVNADSIPDRKTLIERATQMMPLLRYLQQYHELEGMLANPRLPELAGARGISSPAPSLPLVLRPSLLL